MAEYVINTITEKQHYKFRIASERVEKLVIDLKKTVDNEKIRNGEILFKTESIAFINNINNALATYKETCLSEVEKIYNDEQIAFLIEEYNILKVRRDELIVDPDINDIEANDEFQRIKERVNKLFEIRDKLIKAGWTD